MGPQPVILAAHELRIIFTFLNGWWGQIRRRTIFCGMWKSHYIQISSFIKFDRNMTTLILLYIVHGCFCATMKKGSSYNQGGKVWKAKTSSSLPYYRKVFGAWSKQHWARTEEDSPHLTYSRDDPGKLIPPLPINLFHICVSVHECVAVADFWPTRNGLAHFVLRHMTRNTPAKVSILQNGTSNHTKFPKYRYRDFKNIWANVQVGGKRSI